MELSEYIRIVGTEITPSDDEDLLRLVRRRKGAGQHCQGVVREGERQKVHFHKTATGVHCQSSQCD